MLFKTVVIKGLKLREVLFSKIILNKNHLHVVFKHKCDWQKYKS